MNPTYIHLALNHIPILGTLIGTLILLWGIFRRSQEIKNVALVLLVVTALMTIPVFLTGEPSEEIVERLPGISHQDIHDHEYAAERAFIVCEVLGAFALAGLVWPRFRPATPRWLGAVTVVLALVTLVMMLGTAYVGGKIRHPEAQNPPIAIPR